MAKILVKLEVSRKQDYIFSSRKLRDNFERSEEIRTVTETGFFQENAGAFYREAENLVYSGGGQAVLQFPDEIAATAFSRAISAAALRQFPEMELYLSRIPYDASARPKDNLDRLTAALEGKKALRKASFRWLSLGLEKQDRESWRPALPVTERVEAGDRIKEPEGFRYPLEFRDLNGPEEERKHGGFIAVVHIDGNAMGKRMTGLLSDVPDWESACARLQSFSKGVDEAFYNTFSETVEVLARCGPAREDRFLPIRRVIRAGDDVCFVTAGSLGLECARLFLERLAAKTNPADGKPYAACAGVALVHQKYPFHMAYKLAEELCDSAKRRGADLNAEEKVSLMDWHIEFGQLKKDLDAIREDYFTENGKNRLELRPVTVVVPEDLNVKDDIRTYAFFRTMCSALRGEYGSVARGKLKNLRAALKQGETETEFFLKDREILKLFDHIFPSANPTEDVRRERLREMLRSGIVARKEAFASFPGETEKRSYFFDALEMIDHFTALEEVKRP